MILPNYGDFDRYQDLRSKNPLTVDIRPGSLSAARRLTMMERGVAGADAGGQEAPARSAPVE